MVAEGGAEPTSVTVTFGLGQGSVLGGRYRLKRLIGRGGMGAVFEAVQEDLGRTVALKCLDPVLATHPEQLERFRREATSAAALGHPNIVSVTDFGPIGKHGEPPFLVMELLAGESLGALLERESVVAAERVAFIASQVLAALGAAHAAGIIHRDIKPDNVFLTQAPAFRDLVKVLDFGVAKLEGESGGRLTGTGAMLGTPAYMAPEQARGAAIDHRADLYAVGATMYQALSGRMPHDAPSFPAMLFAIVEEAPAPLTQLRPDLPPGLVQVVERAMKKDPAERFPSAEAMRAALAPFLSGSAAAPVSSDAPTLVADASVSSAVPTPVVVRSNPPSAPATMATGPSTDAGMAVGPTHASARSGRSVVPILAAAVVAVALIAGVVVVLLAKISADEHAGTKSVAASEPKPSSESALVQPSATMTAATSTTSVASGAATAVGELRPPDARTAAAATASTTGAAASSTAPSATHASRVYGGARGYRSSLDFSECKGCDWDGWKSSFESESAAISQCLKASVNEPPIHEFPYYWVHVQGDGSVASIEVRGDPTPNLDRCLTALLRRHPITKASGEPGLFKVGFSGECPTFQCK